MKSRISCFDTATFKKDITRFLPLWVLYALLTFLIASSANSGWSHPVITLGTTISGFAFVNLIYGALSSQLLFGELFNSRLCNALHAMPVTREARFGSHVCAGLLFSFVPNLVVSLLIAPSFDHLWWVSFLWLAAICLQYLFFFGVGVLSVMCTGSRFAMVVVYLIVNFLPIVVWWFVGTIFIPMMPGVLMDGDIFAEICPAAQFISASNQYYFEIAYDGLWYRDHNSMDAAFLGFGDGWLYLFIAAGVGVAMIGLALLLYRRRKLECAGDFIAVQWIRPIFLVLYTLCGGVFLSIFDGLFGNLDHIIFLAIGIIIGFFTGKMLLERTIRVFRKKTFLQFAAFVLAIGISLWGVSTDVLGIVRYVPKSEDVEYVEIHGGNISRHKLTEQEDIELVQQIHSYAIENLDHEDDYFCSGSHQYFRMEYHLKNGRIVTRYYHICVYSAAGDLLDEFSGKN